MTKNVDMENLSQSAIVKLPVDLAGSMVTGVESLDTHEPLAKALALAVEEVSQGRSDIEYVVIAVAKADVIEGSDKTESSETTEG